MVQVTSLEWVDQLKAAIINGPTTENQPPFSWNNFSDTSHHGMPNDFKFAWEEIQPHVFNVTFQH